MTKKYLLFLSIIVTSMLLWVVPVQADGNIKTTLSHDHGELTVGDPVQLTLEVAHPAGQQVIVPTLEQVWGNFEVQGQSQTETSSNPDGSETTRQKITVTLFEPGTFETPALPLTISDSNGQVFETIAMPTTLTVVPVLAEGDTTLADIRPQMGMDLPSLLPAILVGLLIITALGATAWWLYRRWRGGALLDNRLPYQIALDELARIESLNLPQQKQFKRHYTLVTDCLRTYIEKQYQVHTFDRTTAELKQSLNQSTMDIEPVRQLVTLFSDADFVKFAKLVPSLAESADLTAQARHVVEVTKPKPEVIQQPEASNQSCVTTKPVTAQKAAEVAQ